jgi:peptide/nickel transport system ATP-binding protein
MSVPVQAPKDRTALDSPQGIRVEHLTVSYATDAGYRAAVRDVTLDFRAGAITGLIGESGSGKSTLAMALLNGVPAPGRIDHGRIEIDGIGDIVSLRGEALRRVRGRQIGYVFQAAQNSLNPLKRVGSQILDLGRSHGIRDGRALLRDAAELCRFLGLDPDRVLTAYQHELSGGMRQRVNIVFALVLKASILVLDEPTTALDMLSQSQVLKILRDIHEARGLTTILVTHDIGVVAELADRVAVMYAGHVVEQGPVAEVLSRPHHPYTRALIHAIPRVTGDITRARALPGSPPSLLTIPEVGCVFRDRCPLKMPRCETERPPSRAMGRDRAVACFAVSADD